MRVAIFFGGRQVCKLLLASKLSLTYTHTAQVLQPAAIPPEYDLFAKLHCNPGEFLPSMLTFDFNTF